MADSYDPDKRDRLLRERQLDLADAHRVFDEFHLTRWDEKHSYDEDRWITVGLLDGAVVIVVWTERGGKRRYVTIWKANEREREAYHRHRAQSG